MIHALFEERASRSPDAVALAFGKSTLSYRELNRRADDLALQLSACGVGPGVLAALFLDRSVEMVVSMLAVLKAGGAYVPLDPMHPPNRTASILADAQPAVLLTHTPMRSRLPPLDRHIVVIDTDAPAAAQIEQQPAAKRALSPDELAYVIFTSGSTGKPKGVEIEHRAVVNMLKSMQRCPGLGTEDRLLAITTLTFDIAVLEIFLPLVCGARVVIAPSSVQGDSAALADLIKECGATVLQATPSTLRILLDAGWSGDRGLKILCGGEAWTAQLAKEILERCGSLWNMYGPTETTVWSAVRKVETGQRIVIGTPIAKTSFYVLDGTLQLVPVGVPGELCIGGWGLARGYLHQPELTRERFRADPFKTEPGARMYRTGDLVRRLPDGSLEFLGRLDHQIKIAGNCIELGEIEIGLARHPDVKQCVVIASEDRHGDRRIAAYIIPETGKTVRASELRQFLAETLPAYMLPSFFVPLSSFPLTANGKLDRKALPPPDRTAETIDGAPVAPRTPTEQAIAEVWREMLDQRQLSVRSNFFEVGGNSLMAARIIGRINKALAVKLNIAQLFLSPTVEALAATIERNRQLGDRHGTEAKSEIKAIPRKKESNVAPMSFGQERLWFLDQLQPNSAAYNIPMGLRLGGGLNVSVLQRCLNEVLRRHETLRTRFKTVEGRPVQEIQTAASIEIALVDLTKLSKPEREVEVKRLCVEEAQRPFELTRDLLLRATLYRLGEADYILLLNVHHIASDGWSMGLLIRELTVLYAAFVEGQPSPLPELPVQYADFAVWQRERLQGEVLEKQLGYWRKQLEGAPALLELPTDYPRPAVQSYRGAVMHWELPKPLLATLRELSGHEGGTLFMTLLAGFQTLLHRYTGADDILVGSPIAGRDWVEIEPLIGMFVNTLALRGDLSGNPSFRSFLGRTRLATLESYAHQDIPFERLVDELHPQRDLSRSPFFQVMFVSQDAPRETAALAGLEVTPMAIDSGTSKFDLTLFVRERGGVLHAAVEYNTDLFEAETIRRILGHYQTLLEGIVANPDQRLSDLPMLTSAERRQILVDWNQTKKHYPRKCVHELFEAQVERTPEFTAVIFEGNQLTYRQLNERANQLARHLRKLGVGPNILVGICVERSLEVVIGLLGILKAGGAYVPMDPAYPKERLCYLLRDADASVLLIQEQSIEKLGHGTGTKIVSIDSDCKAFQSESRENLPINVSAENLIYAIYTSGSTGSPKGAGVYHRGFTNLVHWFTSEFAVSSNDSVLLFSSLSFDLTQKNIFAPLICGGKLHLMDVGPYDPGLIVDSIYRSQITLLNCTPSAFYPLIESADPANLKKVSSLRHVFLGGEPISIQRLRPWIDTAGCRAEVVNTYGPTECTDIVSFYRLQRSQLGKYDFVPTGGPISNVQLAIMNEDLQPCPIGVTGELCVAGIGVGAGYFNNPELTTSKFIVNSFPELSGQKLYKTGDLARYLPSGTIEYLGRMDHQVKLRGYRIELGEIESALAGLPQVREAVVLVREDVPGDKRLVAYLTARNQEKPKHSELLGLLRARLPDYMVPSVFITLDRLPLTPNGKVDRKAMPAPEQNKLEIERTYTEPTTDSERALCRIWSDWLKLPKVGTRDNFFDLGGNSLLAIRVVGEINKTLNVDLRVSVFFRNQTIEQLARALKPRHSFRSKQPQLVRLRSGRSGPLVYFIGCGPVEMRVAQSISETHAVFGTDIPIPSEWMRPLRSADHVNLPTLSQIGELYADLIHAHAGLSPCVIVGYSFFGKVAFEAAHALQRDGGNVAHIILIDAFNWTDARPGWRQSLQWIWRGGAAERDNDITYLKKSAARLRDCWRLLRWLIGRIPDKVKQRGLMLLHPASGYFDDEGQSVEVLDLYQFAGLIRKPPDRRPLKARGLLFRAEYPGEKILPGHDFTNGWGGLFARGLEIVHMAGSHLTIVRDRGAGEAIGRQINAVLDRFDFSNDEVEGTNKRVVKPVEFEDAKTLRSTGSVGTKLIDTEELL